MLNFSQWPRKTSKMGDSGPLVVEIPNMQILIYENKYKTLNLRKCRKYEIKSFCGHLGIHKIQFVAEQRKFEKCDGTIE